MIPLHPDLFTLTGTFKNHRTVREGVSLVTALATQTASDQQLDKHELHRSNKVCFRGLGPARCRINNSCEFVTNEINFDLTSVSNITASGFGPFDFLACRDEAWSLVLTSWRNSVRSGASSMQRMQASWFMTDVSVQTAAEATLYKTDLQIWFVGDVTHIMWKPSRSHSARQNL